MTAPSIGPFEPPMPDLSPPVPPEPPRAKRRSALRVLLWIVVPLVALCGVGYWNAQRVAEATLERHRAKFEQERKDLPLRAKSRPALREPVARGTAEEVAERFAAAVERVPEEERHRLSTYVYDETEAASPEEQDRILALHPEPLAALADILHVPGTTTLPPLDRVDQEFSVRGGHLAMAVKWAHAAILRALARGNRVEGPRVFDLIAQTVTLGCDLERRGTLVGRVLGAQVQRAGLLHLPAAFGRGPADRGDARALVSALDALEAARPSLEETAAIEHATFRGLFSVREMDMDEGLRNTGWRHLWSGKLFRKEALEELDAGYDRLRPIISASATDPLSALGDAVRAEDATSNPIARMGLGLWSTVLRVEFSRNSVWRAGRTALAVALYASDHGEPPASLAALVPTYLPVVPIDPWDGKPLRYAAGPPARVWSIGRDGKDDGGTPGPDPDAVPESRPGDFVITIPPLR